MIEIIRDEFNVSVLEASDSNLFYDYVCISCFCCVSVKRYQFMTSRFNICHWGRRHYV